MSLAWFILSRSDRTGPSQNIPGRVNERTYGGCVQEGILELWVAGEKLALEKVGIEDVLEGGYEDSVCDRDVLQVYLL
jgi:hypothetical protein